MFCTQMARNRKSTTFNIYFWAGMPGHAWGPVVGSMTLWEEAHGRAMAPYGILGTDIPFRRRYPQSIYACRGCKASRSNSLSAGETQGCPAPALCNGLASPATEQPGRCSMVQPPWCGAAWEVRAVQEAGRIHLSKASTWNNNNNNNNNNKK